MIERGAAKQTLHVAAVPPVSLSVRCDARPEMLRAGPAACTPQHRAKSLKSDRPLREDQGEGEKGQRVRGRGEGGHETRLATVPLLFRPSPAPLRTPPFPSPSPFLRTCNACTALIAVAAASPSLSLYLSHAFSLPICGKRERKSGGQKFACIVCRVSSTPSLWSSVSEGPAWIDPAPLSLLYFCYFTGLGTRDLTATDKAVRRHCLTEGSR